MESSVNEQVVATKGSSFSLRLMVTKKIQLIKGEKAHHVKPSHGFHFLKRDSKDAIM